jgi:CSLREA domain-containing protein
MRHLAESPNVSKRHPSLFMIAAFAFFIAVPAEAHAANIVVNSFEDIVQTDTSCTLREAIEAAGRNAVFNGCTGTASYGAEQSHLAGTGR